MKRRQMIKTTAALGAMSLWTGVARGQEKKVLKLAHDSPTTSGWHVGAMKIAEMTKKQSDGALEIRVYPSAQLGDMRETAELAQAGTIDMVLLTAGVAASFVPSMNLFGLPFLFNDSEQAAAVYNGDLGRRLMQDADAAGYKGLGFNIRTFRSPMNSVHPITKRADFEGLKIRLMQVPIMIDSYRALGASPVAMPYSEVYTAAQSGVIDGMENTPTGVYSPKFHEVMDYYSLLPVFINTCVLYMSRKSWDALSPAHQTLIQNVAAEGNEFISQKYFELDAENLEKIKAAGVQVDEGPFDLAPFREAVRPVYDQYVPELPKSGQDVVAELQKAWA